MLTTINKWVERTFSIWILFAGIVSFVFPNEFKGIAPAIPWLLGIIMLAMGMTLSTKDFSILSKYPKAVLVGVIAQFVIMPSIAYALAVIFDLERSLAVGVILVGSCPGGTASNVISYMAKGNVALSVAVTSISTLLAPVLTPAIFYLLAHQWLEISAVTMFKSVANIVLFPIILGIIINALFKSNIRAVTHTLPCLSLISIMLILAAVIANSKERLIESGWIVLLVVILHNGLGYLLGYLIAKFTKLPYDAQKTIAIEVGMQNSGLGATLAMKHFEPLAAVPSAIFSVWHNFSGALLANYWASKVNKENTTLSDKEKLSLKKTTKTI
nr:bile acid:sodium symporter family protein [Basilea psittacipulmonis]